MANKLVKSKVLYGDEEKTTNVEPKKLMTLKDMVAPQTIPLFTIHYDLVPVTTKRKAVID
jgi:hypothetical protein